MTTDISKEALVGKFPVLGRMRSYDEIFWCNDRCDKVPAYNRPAAEGGDAEGGDAESGEADRKAAECKAAECDAKDSAPELSWARVEDAAARLERFAPYIMAAFPETKDSRGIIESPLTEIKAASPWLCANYGDFQGRLFLKRDDSLPISGSVKARGGIYEVLKLAESVALAEGFLKPGDDYAKLCSPEAREMFGKRSVKVGSTGNLGLSIGIMASKLGFRAEVHMSADARQWKKDMLRAKGVTVVEYPDDYQKAVTEGRRLAESDPLCHFVDDERSYDLFFGYAVAAKRLKNQLTDADIAADENHPLFVYIPCGVGGAPGGIAYGLKELFGGNVHVFFAEPTHAPCVTLGMLTGLCDRISCKDLGIDGITDADGLAVGRASALVCNAMESRLSGAYTASDMKLYRVLAALSDYEGIRLEPSACISLLGPSFLQNSAEGKAYLDTRGLTGKLPFATHIAWSTGGSMVPEGEMKTYCEKGKENG